MKPNVACIIQSLDGYDVKGAPILGAPAKWKCAVVKLSGVRKATSVRTDKAATHANATENTADSRLLLHSHPALGNGCRIIVNGLSLNVVSMRDQFDANGKFDHYEVECQIMRVL